MKKSAMVLVFLFVLVACAPRDAEPARPVDFRTGSEGLYMSFVPNLPPPKLFDAEPMSVMLQLENRGTSPLGKAGDNIYLSGFDTTIISNIPSSGALIPQLEGRGPFLPQGGIGSVSFTGLVSPLTAKRIDKYEPTILATACYGYETVASAQVCIDPNPFAPTSVQRVCSPGIVSTGSQGAPIAVTSVGVNPSPGKTRFEISIQNVGRGDVFKHGGQYLNSCSPYNLGLKFDEVDFLQVSDVMLSGKSIKASCKPVDRDGHIRLTNGQAKLFCETDQLSQQSPYLTPLNIILKYGYRSTIATRVEIRPVS